MFKIKMNHDPIVVVVVNGQWGCYGEPTKRSNMLMKHLKKQGGVAPSVPEGRYHYNITRQGFRFIAELTPLSPL